MDTSFLRDIAVSLRMKGFRVFSSTTQVLVFNNSYQLHSIVISRLVYISHLTFIEVLKDGYCIIKPFLQRKIVNVIGSRFHRY